MKVEPVQTAGRDGDIVHNLKHVLATIANCTADTELMVFPETYLTDFPSEDNIAALAEPLDGPMVSAVQCVARERSVSVAIDIIEADTGRYYNTTLLIAPDGTALEYRKIHLWASDRGILTFGDRYATALWDGIQVGLLVRLDIKLLESAWVLDQLDAELVIVTNGNMDSYDSTHYTATMVRVMENRVYAVVINRVGHGDGGLAFTGGGAVVDPYDQLLCEAGREECRQIAELDLGRLQDVRWDYYYLEERHLVLFGERREHPDGLRELLIP